MTALKPWSSSYKPCRTLQNHQLQETMKLLQRSMTMTMQKSIDDVRGCSQTWMRRNVAGTTLTGTARSTIRDFLVVVELRIVNKMMYQSTLERLRDPRLAVKRIEQKCQRLWGGLEFTVYPHVLCSCSCWGLNCNYEPCRKYTFISSTRNLDAKLMLT